MTNTTNILHKELSYSIVGCIYEVRNTFGSGQKEIVYQNALSESFEKYHLPFCREVNITIRSPETGKSLGSYLLDFVVDGSPSLYLKRVIFTNERKHISHSFNS